MNQYLRQLKLIVSQGNTTLDLSNLHIQFQTTGSVIGTLKHAVVTAWNPAQKTVNSVLKEFTDLTLIAGYQTGPFGSIFEGQIARIEAGKENATDSYLRIYAQDADQESRFTMTNAPLAAGWTDDVLYQQLMADFQGAGLQAGYKPTFTTTAAPRGIALLGRTANLMNELASRQGCTWFIEDGKVNLMPINGSIPGPQPVLSSGNGLIGVPTLTLGGVNVRCLLNPNIKQGIAIKIDNSQITKLSQNQPYLNDLSLVPSIPGDGTYAVHNVSHSGDTRGNNWYTDMVCASLDQTGNANTPLFYDSPEAV